MKFKELNRTNISYDGKKILKYKALYTGGSLFKDHVKEFLVKGAGEREEDFKSRCSMARYEPHIGTVVNHFAAQLFSSPFVVRSEPETIDEFYSKFKEDCDLNGTDLDQFVYDLFITALIHGRSFVLANLPSDGGMPAESLEDQLERGIGRVWLKKLENESVINWKVDENKNLVWVKTYSCEYQEPDDPFIGSPKTVLTWKIYTVSSVKVFQYSYSDQKDKPKEETEIPLIDSFEHGFSKVPILCLSLKEGLWLTDRLADVQIEHFDISNSLLFAQKGTCFCTYVHEARDNADKQNPNSSSGFGIRIGEGEKIYVVSPPTDSFDSLEKRITNAKDSIYRLSSQMALAADNSPGTIKRSGESKSKDSESSRIGLHSFAEIVKCFVEELFELISDARGDVSVTFSIEGMDCFQIDDAQSTIEAATMAQQFDIPSITFKKELAYKIVASVLPNATQKIKDEIRKEIQSSPDESFDKKLPEPSLNDKTKEEDSKNKNPVDKTARPDSALTR